jgi:hypothetical protein
MPKSWILDLILSWANSGDFIGTSHIMKTHIRRYKMSSTELWPGKGLCGSYLYDWGTFSPGICLGVFKQFCRFLLLTEIEYSINLSNTIRYPPLSYTEQLCTYVHILFQFSLRERGWGNYRSQSCVENTNMTECAQEIGYLQSINSLCIELKKMPLITFLNTFLEDEDSSLVLV